MSRPQPHPESGVFRIRKTIPPQYRDAAKRLYGVSRELTLSLGTKNAAEARRLAPAALSELESKLAAIRAASAAPPVSLSHMQVYGIAGEFYREQMAGHEANPGSFESWERTHGDLIDALPRDLETGEHGEYAPTARDLREAETLLSTQRIAADPRSVRAVAQALWLAKVHLAATLMRRARGDYRPDEYAGSFPPLDLSALPSPAERSRGTAGGASFDDLLNGWARDRDINPDTRPIDRALYDRKRTLARLGAFLGHAEAVRVTRADAVRWKESMTEKKPATVANDISEMSAIWKWGIQHGKASENPFAGLLPSKKSRSRKSSRRAFTQEEAALILTRARREAGALRWLPWLQASTGARVTEYAQAAKVDVILTDGHPYIRIHDDNTDDRAPGEAPRSVKNTDSIRNVPIHPQVIAEGFLDYVKELPDGSALFPDLPPDAVFGSRGASATDRISRWIRNDIGITDPAIGPSHSWRHYFIENAQRARLPAPL